MVNPRGDKRRLAIYGLVRLMQSNELAWCDAVSLLSSRQTGN